MPVKFLALCLVIAGSLWWWNHRASMQAVDMASDVTSEILTYALPVDREPPEERTPVDAPSIQDPQRAELNLSLPEDYLAAAQAEASSFVRKYDLGYLFSPRISEKNIKMSGNLILSEKKPVDPNATVLDQIEGAEVGVTIKTP